jgi:hypothetical protein
LSYRYNDLLAFYANRSVLNYRRILKTNPAIGRFDGEMYEACLVKSVDNLLEQKVPTYFIYEEGQGMPNLLQLHYKLTDVMPEKAVFEIGFPDEMNSRELLQVCQD